MRVVGTVHHTVVDERVRVVAMCSTCERVLTAMAHDGSLKVLGSDGCPGCGGRQLRRATLDDQEGD